MHDLSSHSAHVSADRSARRCSCDGGPFVARRVRIRRSHPSRMATQRRHSRATAALLCQHRSISGAREPNEHIKTSTVTDRQTQMTPGIPEKPAGAAAESFVDNFPRFALYFCCQRCAACTICSPAAGATKTGAVRSPLKPHHSCPRSRSDLGRRIGPPKIAHAKNSVRREITCPLITK